MSGVSGDGSRSRSRPCTARADTSSYCAETAAALASYQAAGSATACQPAIVVRARGAAAEIKAAERAQGEREAALAREKILDASAAQGEAPWAAPLLT
jgi:hypothetical protein